MSGLSFGAGPQEQASLQAAELLLDWLSGNAGDVERAARVARVLIAGNLISEKASDKAYSAKVGF